ncbi:MAG: peroxiredoxin-like family protein [Woeseiaceae bacterium]
MSLKAECEAVINQFMKDLPEEVMGSLNDFIGRLVDSEFSNKAINVGDKAPDFSLPNIHGRQTKLSDLLKDGPVVINFYRGGWCPFCSLELKGYQNILSEIQKEGANLVGISPQTPDNSLSTAENFSLEFEVLSDSGNSVANAYGLVFELEQAIREIYRSFEFTLPEINGDDSWTLPIPATYVINQDGTVVWADVNANYTVRAEPSDVLQALRKNN